MLEVVLFIQSAKVYAAQMFVIVSGYEAAGGEDITPSNDAPS